MDCSRCPAHARGAWGCKRDKAGDAHKSITAPTLAPRLRCPKAFLNPETDLYDPDLSEMIAMHFDLEAYGTAPSMSDMLDDARVVEGLRVVRSTWNAMEAVVIRHRIDKSKRDAAAARGRRG